jgi:hypothetical protein
MGKSPYALFREVADIFREGKAVVEISAIQIPITC